MLPPAFSIPFLPKRVPFSLTYPFSFDSFTTTYHKFASHCQFSLKTSKFQINPSHFFSAYKTSSIKMVKQADLTESWDTILDPLGDVKNVDYINGPLRATPSWELESLRLFGKSEKDVRLTLYRDTAYWCPYCHRVQILLEEKKIPYRFRKINMNCYGRKPPEFLAKVPGGLLPVLETLDGKIITESLDIMIYIEDTFTEFKPLLPDRLNKEAMSRVNKGLRLERALAGNWLQWLRGPVIMSRGARNAFEKTLDDVDAHLAQSSGPFFGGSSLDFVDCMFAPFLERMLPSLQYWKDFNLFDQSKWPHIHAWFMAMESVPAYFNGKSEGRTHVLALPPQIGRCNLETSQAKYKTLFDNQCVNARLDDVDPAKLPHRQEAAIALVNNHEAVTRDSLRGAGITESQTDLVQSMDQLFRICTILLLSGKDTASKHFDSLQLRTHPQKAVLIKALEYERDRVCTPRDMRINAATQFQGALNWCIENLG